MIGLEEFQEMGDDLRANDAELLRKFNVIRRNLVTREKDEEFVARVKILDTEAMVLLSFAYRGKNALTDEETKATTIEINRRLNKYLKKVK